MPDDPLSNTPLPPASDLQGDAGHDDALEVARGARLLRLRAARLTYAQMAEQEGYANAGNARRALGRALARHEAENVVELRAIENEALDQDERVIRQIILNVEAPDATRLRAIDTRTRLSARRSRLNGMDAPLQVEVSAGVQQQLAAALDSVREVIYGQVTDVTDEPMEA